MKTEFRKRREARDRLARALRETKKRFGLGSAIPSDGIAPDPLAATSWERKPKTAPTSDRIPGSAPATNLMHDHKWKRGAQDFGDQTSWRLARVNAFSRSGSVTPAAAKSHNFSLI